MYESRTEPPSVCLPLSSYYEYSKYVLKALEDLSSHQRLCLASSMEGDRGGPTLKTCDTQEQGTPTEGDEQGRETTEGVGAKAKGEEGGRDGRWSQPRWCPSVSVRGRVCLRVAALWSCSRNRLDCPPALGRARGRPLAGTASSRGNVADHSAAVAAVVRGGSATTSPQEERTNGPNGRGDGPEWDDAGA